MLHNVIATAPWVAELDDQDRIGYNQEGGGIECLQPFLEHARSCRAVWFRDRDGVSQSSSGAGLEGPPARKPWRHPV